MSEDITAVIEELPCFKKPVQIESLSGGITNENYLVESGGQRYVARACRELRHLGIDRRNEALCQNAAHAAGVAPAIVHREPGFLVSDFVEGEVLSPVRLRDIEVIRRVVAALRALHSWDRIRGELYYFSPFQTCETYAVTACSLGAELPADLDALLDDARLLARRLEVFRPVLCHNDLLAANLIVPVEAEAPVQLIDWEYGGIGNPLFDLASLSGNANFDEELDAELLRAYDGEVRPERLAGLELLKLASLLREALWSAIQTRASAIAFDYLTYYHENLEAYRSARARLAVR